MKKILMLALAACAASQANAAQPLRCVIEPDRIAEVGTPVIGVVESVLVDRGDVVKQGQLLAQLRASVERASVNAAEVRAQADADVQAALAAANRTYEARFGHIYIVCATGRSASEMLEIAQSRLGNAADDELRIAAAEQAKITRLRLLKLVG